MILWCTPSRRRGLFAGDPEPHNGRWACRPTPLARRLGGIQRWCMGATQVAPRSAVAADGQGAVAAGGYRAVARKPSGAAARLPPQPRVSTTAPAPRILLQKLGRATSLLRDDIGARPWPPPKRDRAGSPALRADRHGLGNHSAGRTTQRGRRRDSRGSLTNLACDDCQLDDRAVEVG